MLDNGRLKEGVCNCMCESSSGHRPTLYGLEIHAFSPIYVRRNGQQGKDVSSLVLSRVSLPQSAFEAKLHKAATLQRGRASVDYHPWRRRDHDQATQHHELQTPAP
jgi:hypothetical protein